MKTLSIDASPYPSTSHGKETPESFHVAQQVQKDTGAAVHAGDMEVFFPPPMQAEKQVRTVFKLFHML
jgi:hypothetical protein